MFRSLTTCSVNWQLGAFPGIHRHAAAVTLTKMALKNLACEWSPKTLLCVWEEKERKYENVLASLVQFGALVSCWGPLLRYCIYLFLKLLSSCKCYLDLARSFPFPLNPLALKLQARTMVFVCLRASGLQHQQHVAGGPQITFRCSFRTGYTTQTPKNLPPTAPGGSGMLTAINYASEARIRPSGLQ